MSVVYQYILFVFVVLYHHLVAYTPEEPSELDVVCCRITLLLCGYFLVCALLHILKHYGVVVYFITALLLSEFLLRNYFIARYLEEELRSMIPPKTGIALTQLLDVRYLLF